MNALRVIRRKAELGFDELLELENVHETAAYIRDLHSKIAREYGKGR